MTTTAVIGPMRAAAAWLGFAALAGVAGVAADPSAWPLAVFLTTVAAVASAAAWLARRRLGSELIRLLVFAVWTACGVSAVAAAGPALLIWLCAPFALGAACREPHATQEGLYAGVGGAAAVGVLGAFGALPVGYPTSPAWTAAAAAIVFLGWTIGGALTRARRGARASARRIGAVERALQASPATILRVRPDGRVADVIAPGEGIAPDVARAGADLAEHLSDADARAFAAALADGGPGGRVTALEVALAGVPVAVRMRALLGGDVAMVVTPAAARPAAPLAPETPADALREQRQMRFFAGVTHELRTPLNAILGFADMIQARTFGPLHAKYAEYGALIHQSAEHMVDLVGDLLDYSKIEAGRFELAPQHFDARVAVEAALEMILPGAQRKRVTIARDLGAAPAFVIADPRALKQIALNLLSNAVKFTPEGGQVAVALMTDARDLILVVRDTGPGIAPDDLEALGGAYVQTDAGRTSDERGTGLGLALVVGLAALHGGRLVPHSVVGEGATMEIILPVTAGPDAARSARGAAADAPDQLDVRARMDKVRRADWGPRAGSGGDA